MGLASFFLFLCIFSFLPLFIHFFSFGCFFLSHVLSPCLNSSHHTRRAAPAPSTTLATCFRVLDSSLDNSPFSREAEPIEEVPPRRRSFCCVVASTPSPKRHRSLTWHHRVSLSCVNPTVLSACQLIHLHAHSHIYIMDVVLPSVLPVYLYLKIELFSSLSRPTSFPFIHFSIVSMYVLLVSFRFSCLCCLYARLLQ